MCKKILEHIGLNPERLRIEFMSGADGNLLAEATDDFSKQLKELGPIGESEGLEPGVLRKVQTASGHKIGSLPAAGGKGAAEGA
jgi:F420-non-reducing hydrogenase iron-sulfur subunit